MGRYRKSRLKRVRATRKPTAQRQPAVPGRTDPSAAKVESRAADGRFPIVGIGASAGGLAALGEFFAPAPLDIGAAFIVVSHQPSGHVSLLPDLLQKHTKMPIVEATDGMRVAPNHVYLSTPGRTLAMLQGALHVMDPDSDGRVALPIDYFFRSLADDQGDRAIGYAVETFASATEYLARSHPEDPCCLLLDVRMPGLSGLELQEALARTGRQVSIVFISGHGDVPGSVKAMKSGAADFLTKPVDDRELLGAIERAVTKALQDRREQTITRNVHDRIKTLTPREAQVFALVVTGRLNKEIAADLGIGEKTVKVHRGRVMEKMRAGSVAELVRLADQGGVIAANP